MALQQGCVARQQGVAVGGGHLHALAGHFRHGGYGGLVGGAVRLLRRAQHRAGNGVVGAAFGQGGHAQQFIFVHASGGQHGVDLKHAFRQRAGLVQGGHAHVAQVVQHRTALDENAPPGGGPDAAEIAQRNGNEQGAGAGNDQQHQGAVKPL